MPQFLTSLMAYTLSFCVSTHSLFLVEVGYRGCRGPVLCQTDNAASNINLWALNNIVPIYGEFPLPKGHCNEEACGERDIAGWWAGLELTGFSVSRSARE